MSTTQKIIKYCAIAFAIFLSISIIGGIVGALASVPAFLGSDDNVGEMKTYSVDAAVERLELELGGAQLEIKTGSGFSVKSNHNHLNLDNRDGVLKIWEEHSGSGWLSKDVKVILTVPEGFTFKKAEILAGAGTVKIDTLQADNLTLNLGAGKTDIDCLVANTSARIDGGVGELTIRDGNLSNLDFDMGVGDVKMESRLTGNCDIDYGVGELDLTLIGEQEDYCIALDKGLGNATLDGQKMGDGGVYGTGGTKVEIDGGIGDLRIDYAKTAIGGRE